MYPPKPAHAPRLPMLARRPSQDVEEYYSCPRSIAPADAALLRLPSRAKLPHVSVGRCGNPCISLQNLCIRLCTRLCITISAQLTGGGTGTGCPEPGDEPSCMALEQARWHAEDRAMHQGLEGLACEENGMEMAAECEGELRNGGATGRKGRSHVEHRAMHQGAMGLACGRNGMERQMRG